MKFLNEANRIFIGGTYGDNVPDATFRNLFYNNKVEEYHSKIICQLYEAYLLGLAQILAKIM